MGLLAGRGERSVLQRRPCWLLGAMVGTLVASVLLLAAPATIDLDGDVPWVVAGSQVRPAPPPLR